MTVTEMASPRWTGQLRGCRKTHTLALDNLAKVIAPG